MKLDAVLILIIIIAGASYLAPGGLPVGLIWGLCIANSAYRTPLVGKNGLLFKK